GNFQAGDTIALTGINDITAHTVINGNTLDLTRSGGSHIDLTLDRDYTTAAFATTTVGTNTDITTTTVTCFAAGTTLDTPDGSVAVEALRVGDLVLTASGEVRPIRWIGRRQLDAARHPAPNTVRPIRILADALADGSPRRDLLLSPDHALLLDGMLIPVRLLRNDTTIRREEHCSIVIYYHVELDTHDVLLADGAAAESYLDTGNRDSFENANLPVRLYPILEGGQHRRETESCAPFVADPVRTEPVWRRLVERAVQFGQAPPERRSADTDPALRVVCGGWSFAPVAVDGACHTFMLPAWKGTLQLRSRHAIPNEVTPWIEDQRRLGVMIRQLTLTTASDTRTIPVDDAAIGSGWWDVERDDQATWRWTDGDAAIAIASAGPCRLDIEIAGTATFARRPVVTLTTQAAA
ncbi:MAG TPA: Hint domain-containing protein, partial [Rhodopila sp.]